MDISFFAFESNWTRTGSRSRWHGDATSVGAPATQGHPLDDRTRLALFLCNKMGILRDAHFYCISRAQEGSARARRLRSRHPCGCLGRFGGKKVHWTFFFFRLTPSRDDEIYILKIIPKS